MARVNILRDIYTGMPAPSYDPHTRDDPLYECYDCGQRETDPDGRLCGDCGGYLRNIARARDY